MFRISYSVLIYFKIFRWKRLKLSGEHSQFYVEIFKVLQWKTVFRVTTFSDKVVDKPIFMCSKPVELMLTQLSYRTFAYFKHIFDSDQKYMKYL